MIRPEHRTALLLAAAFVVCVWGLMWGLPNAFDFAQDSLVPMGKLAERGFDLEAVTAYRYPPAHFMLLRVVFVPVSLLGRLPAFADNEKMEATLFILAARVVSLAMALGTVWIVFLLGRRLWNETAGYAAALLFVFSPLTLYYAKNANLDIPYVFWLAWALFIYVRILQENRKRDYVWLGILSALAVTTKDQAYAFLLLMPVPLIWNLLRPREDTAPPKKFMPALATGAVAFLGVFALVHNLLFDWNGFVRHVKTILGPGVEGWRLFGRGPGGQARLLVETILRVFDAWTPAGLALAGLGVGLAFRRGEDRRLPVALLAPVVSYYLFFLAIIGYVPTRFVLPVLLLASLFAGRGFAWLWEKASPRRSVCRAAAVLFMIWVGLAGLSVDFVMANYSRYAAQKWLQDNVPVETQICWIGDMRDMPRFNEPLDPKPCEPTAQAIAEAAPDMLVVSLAQEHAASGTRGIRLSSMVRANLGDWGLTDDAKHRRAEEGFMQPLVQGEFGYAASKRFASPIAPLVPEVCESLNRTIVILEREP